MLLTNHVLSGALVGAVTRRPVPAFLLGVASHFVLDAIPHWGQWSDPRMLLRVAVPDGLAGLAAMAGLTAAAPPGSRAAVVAGMAGAALPDMDKPAMLWFGWKLWPRPVRHLHSRIQDEAPSRYTVEIAAAGVFVVSGLTLRWLRNAIPDPVSLPAGPWQAASARAAAR